MQLPAAEFEIEYLQLMEEVLLTETVPKLHAIVHDLVDAQGVFASGAAELLPDQCEHHFPPVVDFQPRAGEFIRAKAVPAVA